MTTIAPRRVAGATALLILFYLLQGTLLASPSQATTHSPDDTGYWLALYPDAVSCHEHLGDADHGVLVDGGKAVELAEHRDDWLGDHWEVLIVNGGADIGGDGNGNAVYEHPAAGVAYYPPLIDGDQEPLVSHWIVCKGYDYDIEGGPSFVIGACDEKGLTAVKFTVEATTEVTISGVPASASDPAYQPGVHELHLAPGTYTWILWSPIDTGIERESGTFTVDDCDTTPTTQDTTPTTQDTTPTTLATAATTIVTQPVPTTSIPFDSLPEEEDEEAEVLGATITTAPEEVSADTLPFTGSESGGTIALGLLALLAGGLLLVAVRGPNSEEDAADLGPWSA